VHLVSSFYTAKHQLCSNEGLSFTFYRVPDTTGCVLHS